MPREDHRCHGLPEDEKPDSPLHTRWHCTTNYRDCGSEGKYRQNYLPAHAAPFLRESKAQQNCVNICRVKQWRWLCKRNQPLAGFRRRQRGSYIKGAGLFIYLFKRKVALPQNKASFLSLSTTGQNGILTLAVADQRAATQRSPSPCVFVVSPFRNYVHRKAT